LSGYNCYDEIKGLYPDETKELELVLRKFSSIPGIKNRNVFGVIKGMTNEASLDGIRKFASEVDLPVVSFEDDKGIYSFRNALSTLIAITKDSTPPANREWYRTLKPIEKKDMERAYQDYRRALELAINA